MKALLISVSVLLTQCTPNPRVFGSSVPESSRVEIIGQKTVDGYAVVILRDTETGVGYLAYNHGLVKLETSNTTKP